jgi:hypothetical protein
MRDYTPRIAKVNLEHGAYYAGRCRNASEARWDANKQRFVHWRTKFGHKYLEEICHPEDEKHFDVFVVECKIHIAKEEIPLKESPNGQ